MRYGFFNSNIDDYDEYGNPIYDRAEEASFFAEFFASFIGNGVYPNPSTGMQVLANNGMNLKIQPGKCFINGYFGLVEDGGEAITIETADSNYNRIDRIVARWDLELRKIIPFVLKGTPASNPVVPSLTRNSNIYEIALADVAVKANTTTITQANITDRRLDTSLCGVVTGVIQQLDTTTLFNQYQAWFEERKQESAEDYQEWFDGFTEPSEEQFTEWFEGIKNRLGEDVATNLQVQIDEIIPLVEQMVEKIKIETLKAENPVGHIRMETTNINPATYLGFGAWTLWGSGRVPVGVNTADTDFATVEKTGGSKTVKLTLAQIPSHAHTFTGTAHSHGLNSHTHTYGKSATTTGSHTLTANEMPSHTHKVMKDARGSATLSASNFLGKYAENAYSDYPYSLRGVASTNNSEGVGKTTNTGGGAGHTHGITVTSTNTGAASGNTANATATGTIGKSGSDGEHSNVQPYITCYMWKRTA